MEYTSVKSIEKWKTEELLEHGYKAPIYLGAGAQSQVWRVWDMSRQEFAVCKISGADKRAERERRMLQSLQHPVFPRYRDAWTGGNCSFLVMEYVSGSTLRKMIWRRGRFTWRQAVHIGVELAEGLLYLHERSRPILFLDVKPDNVMIRQDGRVKLIDVGCACYEGEHLSVVGSRGYSAPEQFAGQGIPGAESDVYALGKLLYFLLTGQEERRSDSCSTQDMRGSMSRRGRRKNRLWKGIPRGLRCLVEDAVYVERIERLPDMRSFLRQLAIYDGTHPWRRLLAGWRTQILRERASNFYYVQNLRRGM